MIEMVGLSFILRWLPSKAGVLAGLSALQAKGTVKVTVHFVPYAYILGMRRWLLILHGPFSYTVVLSKRCFRITGSLGCPFQWLEA